MRQTARVQKTNPFRFAIAMSAAIKVLFLMGVLLWVPAPMKWPLAIAVGIIAGVQLRIVWNQWRRVR